MCVTLRDNTKRPITVQHGTNTIVGNSPARILAAVEDILRDGRAAERTKPALEKLSRAMP